MIEYSPERPRTFYLALFCEDAVLRRIAVAWEVVMPTDDESIEDVSERWSAYCGVGASWIIERSAVLFDSGALQSTGLSPHARDVLVAFAASRARIDLDGQR